MFRAKQETTAAGNRIWTAKDPYESGLRCVMMEDAEPDWTCILVIDIGSTGRIAFVKPLPADRRELMSYHLQRQKEKAGSMTIVKDALVEREIREGGRSIMPPLRQVGERGKSKHSGFAEFGNFGRVGHSSF